MLLPHWKRSVANLSETTMLYMLDSQINVQDTKRSSKASITCLSDKQSQLERCEVSLQLMSYLPVASHAHLSTQQHQLR